MNEDGKRRGLGRGLSALLGEEDSPAEGPARTLPVELLHPGRYQPRHLFDPEAIAALAESIREKGVLQPLLVRDHPFHRGEYEIIAGERRWRAAQEAQLHEVPVVIRTLSDSEALEIALVENLQREDLSVLEEAEAYRRLMDEFHHTQDAVAESVGKSRSHVANMLRLLELPAPVKQKIEARLLSPGHARALIGASDPEALAEEVIRDGLNVRQTEHLAQRAKGKATSRKPVNGYVPPLGEKDADTRAVERALSNALGLKVTINPQPQGSGSLTVHYQTLEQLDEVLRKLSQPSATRMDAES